ncbi:MAG: CBS and ACT domain-containing protein [Caldiserica bacterium]|jgi:acetoin utilization protein AcuB|nr:CBS and ACT domain-containing protein [Caldisericota bacterium]MDH7562441.1 CBS and ACT domain-containing protein [Caldisericota bacterium]
MFVKNHMTPNPITVGPDTPIFEALNLMKKHRIKQLPVVQDRTLMGLVTERDLLTVSPSPATTLSIYEINYLLSKMTVKEVMIKSPARISPEATIEEAAVIMREHRFGSLLVMEGEELVGIITESDLFEALIKVFGFRRPGVRVVLEAENKIGTLADLLSLVRDHQINVIGLACMELGEKVQIMVRLATSQASPLIEELKSKGYNILSVS